MKTIHILKSMDFAQIYLFYLYYYCITIQPHKMWNQLDSFNRIRQDIF